MDNNVIFFALGEKAYAVLFTCLPKYHKTIRLVVVGRDSGVQNDFAENIFSLCKSFDVMCLERNEFSGFDDASDYAIAVGWRWMVPASIEKLIVMHDSLLPKYRGFAPLVNCLINGERIIGVSAIFGAKEYDRGNIIFQKSLSIEYPIKIQDAIVKISAIYAELVEKIIECLGKGDELLGVPQSENLASYSLWRDNEDYFIDWHKSSEYISRFVDAVGAPYAGAKSLINGEIIKIIDVTPVLDVKIEDRESSVGKVIFIVDGAPIVVCKEGLIMVNEAKTLNGESILPFKKFRSRFN